MVNEQKLLEAYNAVKFHGANKRIAAQKSGVSCSTLRKRLKNGNKNKSTSHEKQMNFTLAEEDLISHWIISENAMGRAPTDKEIRDFGIKLASAHGRSIILGIHWSERFRSRRPELQEILGTKLGHSRGKAMNSEELPRFFEILKNLLKEYKIKRENIYNMDEAGIDVVDIQDCQKVTGPSYVIRSYITSPIKRPRVSVIECICADGTCIDPLVIYRGNKEMERYTPQDIENTPKWEYYIDSSAWTNGIIAQAWLENVFIPQTKPDDINQWRLLIMDNSLSHCTTNFKKKALSNKIYPLYLPPHSTHVTQPLEVTCFRPLKRNCEEADFGYNIMTGIELNKDAFAIFYKKYRAVIFPRFNISGGFKRSGIWPLNPSMVCNMTFATKPKKKKAEELQDNSKDQTSVPPEQVDKFENPLQYLDELLQNEKIDLPIYTEMRMIISRHEQKWKNEIENLKMESLKLQKIIDDLTDDPQEETTKA